jgi:uncharacterized membrane protein
MDISPAAVATAVVVDGLVAGVFVGVALSVVPALSALGPAEYVRVHRMLGRGFHPAMPLIVGVGLLADLAFVVLDPGRRTLAVIAVLATIGVQIVSHYGNVPINRVVHRTDVDGVSAGWRDPRPIWRRLHYVRLAFALAAFGLNVLMLG